MILGIENYRTFIFSIYIFPFQNYYDQGDSGMDLENLGNGALVAYLIITPVLLVCYVLDGRFAVQSLFLEYVRTKIIKWFI